MACDVFVSYSSRDQAAAIAVVHGLEAAGLRCWIAPRDIKAGAVWARAIVEAIGNARVFVVVFSTNADNSSHIVSELDTAAGLGRLIIPFRIEPVEPTGAMAYHLRTRHWLDSFSEDRGAAIQALVDTVNGTREERRYAPAPPPPRTPSAKPRIESTDSAFHLKVPKPALRGTRGRVAALVVVIGLALLAGWRYFGNRDVEGVDFVVRMSTPGSDFRTTVTAQPLRFFESARTLPAYGARTYGTRFAAAQSRFINTEVRLHLDAPGRTLSVPIGCSIFDPSTSVKATFTLENRIAPDGTDWQSASGWGAENPGTWKPGSYRVDCRYGEKLIGRARFEILE